MPLSLKSRLAQDRLLVAPGVFDMLSLKFALRSGAEAVYMTGYGTVASHLGVPDAGLASYREMQERVQVMGAACVEAGIPLIADGDTGYGNPLNVMRTVRGYEAAGASAIQLEDQTFPKKCGHVLGRSVIPKAEMEAKIRAACDARRSDEFLILARTDARTTHGLDEAMERMEAYAEAGADILFLESPETPEELERIGAHFSKPLLINIVEGGRTPVLSHAELERIGYSLAIYPATGFLAVGHLLEQTYAELLAGGSAAVSAPLYDFPRFSDLMGFDEVREIDERYKV